MHNARSGKEIVGPLPVLPAVYDSAVTQNLHVMRQRGLSDVHFLQYDTGTFLPAPQEIQYLQPVFIAKGLEHSCVLFI